MEFNKYLSAPGSYRTFQEAFPSCGVVCDQISLQVVRDSLRGPYREVCQPMIDTVSCQSIEYKAIGSSQAILHS